MVCAPTASDEVVKVAVLVTVPAALSVRVRLLPPSIVKVTVPVGRVLKPGRALTVAVKVTVCPKTDGLADEASVVCELARSTRATIPGDVSSPK